MADQIHHDPHSDSDKTLDRHSHDAHQHHHHHHDYPQMNPPWAQAEGGSLHPGMWKPYEHRKFANPAPLGLSAFALTTFVLSCINMHTRGESAPNIAVPLAFGYGGVVQLLAGMWEMAVGNTFGATALSSYGGFWIAYGLLLTPTWNILGEDGPYAGDTGSVMGFFLTGWFIFTTLLLICTLRSTVAFFGLFFFLDICFLLLACENYAHDLGNDAAKLALQKSAGFFGFLAAFLAWYNALAGMQDSSNSFFQVPVFHFPWSDKGREQRMQKSERALA
ncbi:GPR1/FUN34/yaaH family-domain-containing protein [Dactylonectria estremocensis]|uniref:GPR1/FUN34/yaaH family-domain-containing protein n=1 Tax=Dactylonectria estremocensis TaxID=1079267 RepID=A0A9P9F8M7_9HYPO|nr:GPR1/FUN34/yaaH family-domain-containing protein [Dactylonectria estremocensis]